MFCPGFTKTGFMGLGRDIGLDAFIIKLTDEVEASGSSKVQVEEAYGQQINMWKISREWTFSVSVPISSFLDVICNFIFIISILLHMIGIASPPTKIK